MRWHDATWKRQGHQLIVAVIALILSVNSESPGKDLVKDPFLTPYVQELKKTTSAKELRRIAALAESELGVLHFGYGTGIRNRWILGNRDPALKRFFLANGVEEPDSMSSILIKALWLDLNRSLTPEERAAVDEERSRVARRRAAFEKLEAECEARLEAASGEIARCYDGLGPPPGDPASRNPLDQIIVDRTGRVRQVIFSKGTPSRLKTRLRGVFEKFAFSPFAEDDELTLMIGPYPHGRVIQRNDLFFKR